MRFNNSYVHVISGIKASSREEQKREKRRDANADPIEEERKSLSRRVLSWFTLKNEQPRADKDLYAERRAGVTAGR